LKPPNPIPLPEFAHVPGTNARHPEGAFDAFHDSVRDGMGPDALRDTLAWRAGWYFVEQGFFWEAHEVLEPVWMALPQGGAERAFVQGLIQVANAALKLRMDRPKAARRLCDIAEGHLAGLPSEVMGLRLATVTGYLAQIRAEANL
jgi:hypothetical protein